MNKVGFCCKWMSPEKDKAAEKKLNQVDTTITSLSKRSKAEVEQILLNKVTHNMDSLHLLVKEVASYPEGQRLLRLTSEILPAYTHPVANWVYHTPTMRSLIETGFARVGDLARSQGIRLGFHPDHFVQINTHSASTLAKSIDALEMHVEQMRMMGFTGGWHKHGAHINVHLGGKKASGMTNFFKNWKKLSKDCQDLLTIENDEFSFGLHDVIHVAELCPIVCDIFHHWVNTKGTYIQPDDPLIVDYVIPSWRGTKPLGHFSQPREEHLPDHDVNVLPSYSELHSKVKKATVLRSHSDMCWNVAMNDWAITHLSWMDIEVEAKHKNLASEQLYKQATR